jgi:hypothetical protein
VSVTKSVNVLQIGYCLDEVSKFKNSAECYTPPSEPYRIYCRISFISYIEMVYLILFVFFDCILY